jgi:IclR family transcriptional regulator, pca regulon regulatory protein
LIFVFSSATAGDKLFFAKRKPFRYNDGTAMKKLESRERDREFVSGLARGLSVIECFDEQHPEMTLSEVAHRTGLSPATARRSLRTLASLGYVRAVNRHFTLSARILALGSSYLRSAGIEGALLPELRRLVAQCGDAAGVAILTGNEILYIAHYSEQRGVRPVAGTGVTYPAYPTSLGRMLLSALPKPELDRYLSTTKFEKHTNVTEVDPRKLRVLIEDAKRQGYASIVDQLFYGVTSLSIPINIPPGRVVAALNTSGYSGQVTPESLIKMRLPDMKKSAGRIAELIVQHPLLLHSLEPTGELTGRI